jgi:hypothetical protein
MGHRTLSLSLILRALLLQPDAFDQMRDDDNPAMEGALLVAVIGAGTAILAFAGQLLAAASGPRLLEVKAAVLDNFVRFSAGQAWWQSFSADARRLEDFQRLLDRGWQLLPPMFGAPDPGMAALRILSWPLMGLLAWVAYGLLAHLAARVLRGSGTLNQTLGTTALASAPLLLLGLGIVPYLTLGSFIGIWQLLARYRAIQSAHHLSWGRAVTAAVAPLALALLTVCAVAGAAVSLMLASLGR